MRGRPAARVARRAAPASELLQVRARDTGLVAQLAARAGLEVGVQADVDEAARERPQARAGLVRAGRIALRPGIRQVTETGAIFADGREEPFAVLILGTGYRPGLGDLLAAVPGVLDDTGAPLASGQPTAAPGLYFCGFEVAPGGQFRKIAAEARRLAEEIGR